MILSILEQLHDAVTVLDQIAAWHERALREADEPGAAYRARETLRAMRGGDGSPIQLGETVVFSFGSLKCRGAVASLEAAGGPDRVMNTYLVVACDDGRTRRVYPVRARRAEKV